MSKLELRKVRDFGELVNDTFVFVKENWKPMLKIYAYICGFFIVGGMISSILFSLKMKGIFQPGVYPGMSRSFGWEYFFNIVFVILGYASINLSTFCYLELYSQKSGEAPSTEEVWGYFKFYFWRFLGVSFLLGLLAGIGLIFCIAPGVYLWPIMSIAGAIVIFENATLGYVFDHSFKLIKNNWWTTFGAMAIIMVVIYFLFLAFMLPLSAFSVGNFFLGNYRASSTIIIISSVIQHLGYVFYGLLPIVTGLCYFSLNEAKSGTGLADRINQMGNGALSSDLPEEEY